MPANSKSSSSGPYVNPLAQARESGVLSSIVEEGLVLSESSLSDSMQEIERGDSSKGKPRQESSERSLRRANALGKSMTDPFNQSFDGRVKGGSSCVPHYNYSLREYMERTRFHRDEDSQPTKQSVLGRLQRQTTKFFDSRSSGRWSNASSSAETPGANAGGARESRSLRALSDCFSVTNTVLRFVLTLLTLLLVCVTLYALATVARPAKTVLVRFGRVLGDRSMELNNVTIANANLEGLRLSGLPNVNDALREAFALPPLPAPEPVANVFAGLIRDPALGAREEPRAIEMKDAVSLPREAESKYMSWCQSAPCTEQLRDKCPAIGASLEKGQRNGIPVLPFPREFCAAVRQLNKSGCFCDENIKEIPDGERLTQSRSLIATMCGFRDELVSCD